MMTLKEDTGASLMSAIAYSGANCMRSKILEFVRHQSVENWTAVVRMLYDMFKMPETTLNVASKYTPTRAGFKEAQGGRAPGLPSTEGLPPNPSYFICRSLDTSLMSYYSDF